MELHSNVPQCYAFIEKLLGVSFPFSSYKQVFVEDAYTEVHATSTMCVLKYVSRCLYCTSASSCPSASAHRANPLTIDQYTPVALTKGDRPDDENNSIAVPGLG